ncbi:MAG: lasso peptide biosynthesis B2 protein [Cyanobacteria bacterium]|nr:lasso peptide biosynthesis B2 protein [Cyanobacteriota bacterium]
MSTVDSRFSPWTPVDTTTAATSEARRDARIAWCVLLLIHCALCLGFRRFVRFLRVWPVSADASSHSLPRDVKDVTVAVERACTYYPKHVRCLHRSAAVVLMLRRRGYGASLVIGVQKVPFAAHAWVELDGVIVNDRADLRKDYCVIEAIAPEAHTS